MSVSFHATVPNNFLSSPSCALAGGTLLTHGVVSIIAGQSKGLIVGSLSIASGVIAIVTSIEQSIINNPDNDIACVATLVSAVAGLALGVLHFRVLID